MRQTDVDPPLLWALSNNKNRNLKKIHLYSGILFLVVFAATGQYMLRGLDLPNQDMDAQRMMYRASHLYILFVAALNVAVGCYWNKRSGRFERMLQTTGSAMLVLSQPILLAAFLTEPQDLDSGREVTLLGCLLVLVGVVLTLSCSLRVRQGTDQESVQQRQEEH